MDLNNIKAISIKDKLDNRLVSNILLNIHNEVSFIDNIEENIVNQLEFSFLELYLGLGSSLYINKEYKEEFEGFDIELWLTKIKSLEK